MATMKVNENTEECCQAMESLAEMLEDTLTQAKDFQKEVNDMSWSGEHRDHFVVLLDLTIQYHEDLLTVGEEILECFTNMHENVEGYEDLSAVIKLMGIV
ncbi:MAG: hypothetical protein ACK5LC_10735 [Coprobacillaceae bacterium]